MATTRLYLHNTPKPITSTLFSLGTGFNSTVYSIALQSDGKIVVGGLFNTYKGSTQNRIDRLNADGTSDTGFNTVGTGFNNTVYSIATQPDGKILVGGDFTSYNGVTQNCITRLNADGTRDTGFTIGTGFDISVFSIALQPDGKIVVGGNFFTYNGVSQNFITRLNADGTRDTGFNTVGAGFNTFVQSIALQSDGKILVCGAFTLYNGVTQNRITRLNADGTLDTGFNSGGTGFNSTVQSIALQSDGKILAGGQFTSYNGVTQNYITRLNADGTRDTTFNSGGAGFNDIVTSITIQTDGKILVGGSYSTYNGVTQNYITRLNADGTRDTGFSVGTGFSAFGGQGFIFSIVIQPDGKIVVGGDFTSYNGVTQNNITRLNADGTRNTELGFNESGSEFDNTVYSIALQSDGKILVGGNFTSYNGVTQNRITRLNAEGTRDTGFNSGGTGFDITVQSIALQTDGKILVCGQFTSYNGVTQGLITRLNADGTRDTGFNLGGAGFNTFVQSIALQSDGKIVVGGNFFTYNGVTQNRITRLNADGTLDTGFNSGGTGFNSAVESIALQSDGKILVCGGFTTYNGVTQNKITRLNADGTSDTTFNSGGTGFNSTVQSIALQSDGKILAGGQFTSYNGVTQNYITRLNADGTLDTGFTTTGTGLNSTVQSIALQSDGKILVGGNFTAYNGITQNYITRLNADGTRDTGFTTGKTGFTGFNATVYAIYVQPDGKILVGGFFTGYDLFLSQRIIRLNANGTRDDGSTTQTVFNLPLTERSAAAADSIAITSALVSANTLRTMDANTGVGPQSTTTVTTLANQTAQRTLMGMFCSPTLKGSQLVGNLGFNTGGTGFNSTVLAMALQSDGKILAGGDFGTYNGGSASRIARLNADGTIDTGFNVGGFAGFNNIVSSIALQSDGKILVGGLFVLYNGVTQNRITRLNADGTLDTGFNSGGTGFTVLANSQIYSIVVQTDGKIVVGGFFSTYNGVTQNYIARLNADGTLDTTFNSGGAGFNNTVNVLVLQPDGKILVGGSFTTYNSVTQNSIIRLNADGTKDTGFTIGTGFNDAVTSIVLQPDGKIVIGGVFLTYNGVSSQTRITRLNADGTRDTGFTIGTGFDSPVDYLALQLDGKILVGGRFTSYNGVSQNRITRLNADGTRDTGFTIGTGFAEATAAIVESIVLQTDGKILVGGRFTSYNGVTQNYIARLDAEGILDVPITLTLNVADSETSLVANWWVNALNVYVWRPSTGKIVGVLRDFAGFTIGTGFNNTVESIVQQSDGKILVGGWFTTYNGVTQNYITKLNADGTRDTTFNSGGTGFNSFVNSIVIQSDGKIVVGGIFTSYNGVTQNYITRLNADGTRDTGFTIGTGFNGNVNSITLQPDGKILVGGIFISYNGVTQNRITRLNADGTLDTGFNSGGTGFNNTVESKSIVQQSDGKILVGGDFTTYNGVTQNRITRLNADGTLDTGFNSGGTGFNNQVASIALRSDGKIVVGGSFISYNGVTQNYITRLNADGTRDTTFNSGGTGFGSSVLSIILQSDGKILVGGNFTAYNGTDTQLFITRLNADGTLDTGFNSGGTGFSAGAGVPFVIALQSDGKILVGGTFTSYNGVTQSLITRLNADGALDTPASTTAGLGGLEPTAAASIQVSTGTGITTTPVQAENGDVIICEIWASFTQGMSTSYNGSFFYDGTTVNTTENAVVTNHASFIEFSQNILFGTLAGRSFVVVI